MLYWAVSFVITGPAFPFSLPQRSKPRIVSNFDFLSQFMYHLSSSFHGTFFPWTSFVGLKYDFSEAMFTLYRIVKRSVPETVPAKASVHTRNAAFGTICAPEQDYFAPIFKDLLPETQLSTCSCSHCTGSVSATLRFTTRYSVNIAWVARLWEFYWNKFSLYDFKWLWLW